MPRYDVFIAYAGPNEPHARELYDALSASLGKDRIFFDKALPSGTPWYEEIPTALSESRVTVSVLAVLILPGAALTVDVPGEAAAKPSDHGQLLFTSNRTGNFDIFLIKSDGTYLKNLTNNSAEDSGPAWSPDGKKIVFRRDVGSDADRDWEVFVMEADGSNQINLTNNPADDADPAWSPDGKKIAFTSSRRGRPYRLHVMNADGAKVQMLIDRRTRATYPAWSPDGKKIAYTAYPNNSRALEVFVYDFDSGNEKQLTSLGRITTYAAWTPDGKKLAFWHAESRDDDCSLYMMDADGSNQTQIVTSERFNFDGGVRPAWRPKSGN